MHAAPHVAKLQGVERGSRITQTGQPHGPPLASAVGLMGERKLTTL